MRAICAFIVLMAVCQPAFPAEYIGIVSPASCVNKEETKAAITFLVSHGYRVKLGKSVFASDGYLAGTDQHQPQAFHFQNGHVSRSLSFPQ